MPDELDRIDQDQIFRDSDAPLLVVDDSLVIRAVNPRYLEVTARDRDELIGKPVFEAFPDNPDDPHATGVANLSTSFEEVFRHDRRDRVGLQRYDIRDPEDDTRFLRRFWTPVNSPLHDDERRVVGALHHTEDVTQVVEPLLDPRRTPPGPPDRPPDGSEGSDPQAWTRLVDLLLQEIAAHERARVQMGQLEEALSSRIIIEQAKGVVRSSRQVSAEEAFAMLRHWARSTNHRLVDVCADVVRTLELPPPLLRRR